MLSRKHDTITESRWRSYPSLAYCSPSNMFENFQNKSVKKTQVKENKQDNRKASLAWPVGTKITSWLQLVVSHFLALNQIEPHNCRGSKTFLPVNFRKLAKGSICKAPNKRRYLSEGSFHSEILLICVSAISFRGILSLTVK